MSSFPIQSSVVLARLKPFGISMEKSLSDLIKGIRAHSKESPESLLDFLNVAVNECRDELSTTDLEVKATAVLKLTYLEMYGFDMSWCNFHILEVMSSAKFQQKRIGYLAAIQALKSEPELLILATNQFKKDLNCPNHVEAGLALSGIATIVSPALAKDILDDVVIKLSHSKPYIRKKAVLALFKVFLQYPESLRSTLPRVIEKLDDEDISVVSAAITIICEISKKSPAIFVAYLPKFFAILERTSNNWLIIRILKLFQSLLRIEPRMKKRIMPSILALLAQTDASSLVYECINCIVNGGMISSGSSKDKDVAKICIDHLMKFFETRDSNLKFVGLLALIKILEIFPSFIHKKKGVAAIVMDCLDDGDIIIKSKALEICHYLATEDNMAHLVKTLLLQLMPKSTLAVVHDSLKLQITRKILHIASADNYVNIPNFRWYVTALKELVNLTLLADTNTFARCAAPLSRGVLSTIAAMLGREFMSVSTKVPSIRPYVINKVVIEYTHLAQPLDVCPLLMRDIYWIMGEYVTEFGYADEQDEQQSVSDALGHKIDIFNNVVNCYVDERLNMGVHFPISNKIVHLQEPEVLTVLADALVKLFNGIVADYKTMYLVHDEMPYNRLCELGYFLTKIIAFFEHWQHHSSFEVQERCLSWLEYLKLCLDALELGDGVKTTQDKELEYFAEKFLAQVASPDGSGRSSGSESEEEDSGSSDKNNSDSDSDLLEKDETSQQTATSIDVRNTADPAAVSVEVESARHPRPIPTILADLLPSLFQSYQLHPICAAAQSQIAVPDDLDLDTQINEVPAFCFVDSGLDSGDESSSDAGEEEADTEHVPDAAAQRARLECLKDDPYYISGSIKKTKPKLKLLHLEVEVDRSDSVSPSDLGSLNLLASQVAQKSRKLKKEKVVILLEETLGGHGVLEARVEKKKKKKNSLIIDSVGLENLDLSVPPEDKDDGVDLEAMRKYLEQKVKKKAKKRVKECAKERLKESAEESVRESTKEVPQAPKEAIVAQNTGRVVPVLAAKGKPKKKKKAVISD